MLMLKQGLRVSIAAHFACRGLGHRQTATFPTTVVQLFRRRICDLLVYSYYIKIRPEKVRAAIHNINNKKYLQSQYD